MGDKSVKAQRVFVDADLEPGAFISCSKDQAHYLSHVLRLSLGGQVLLFNGRDGEFLARISEKSKKSCVLEIVEKTREQTANTDLIYLFAPIKRARLDYMVQKAVEMGASKIIPVRTDYCQVSRVNMDRMVANSIEAAEQCGILNVPEVAEMRGLGRVLEGWDTERALVFCDESAAINNPIEALDKIRGRSAAVIIGPEGGFSGDERKLLLGCPFVVSISLGSRIMRADTAAVAALALINAVREN